MASFVQKFGFSKKTGGGNSIQQEIILESMREAQESLATQVSQATSSASNIEVILTRGNKSLAPDVKTQEEMPLEQEMEENSLERLLKAIEIASSPEALSALMQQYEELIVHWSEKVSQLRDEKHLKEYLSIIAALTMLHTMQQNPELLLSGKKIAEILQTSITSQVQAIEAQAKTMQAQNQKLHEQTQQLTKQLSGIEQSLQAAIEGLKKDVRQLTPERLQDNLKQLQETLKQVQELKEKSANGKPLDFKEALESLQKVQLQQQKLIESGKLGDAALQSILQLQQPLQQTLQQANLLQQLQENISRLQTTQIEQVRQNSSQIIQAQVSALATDTLPASILPLEAKGQVPPAGEKAPQPTLSLKEEIKDFLPSQNHNPPSPPPSPTGREGDHTPLQTSTIPAFPEPSQKKEAGLSPNPINQQTPSGMIKDNVIDITARLRERIEVESSAYKPLSKDPLSQGHVCTGSCSHGHSHAAHQDIQPKMMGSDTVSKAHVCTGPNCCGGKGHSHPHAEQHIEKPKPLGLDVVSKGHVYTGPNCCGRNHHAHEIKPQPMKTHSCSSPDCCGGHGAKATEFNSSQHMARAGK